jgi:hypothetical protein
MILPFTSSALFGVRVPSKSVGAEFSSPSGPQMSRGYESTENEYRLQKKGSIPNV